MATLFSDSQTLDLLSSRYCPAIQEIKDSVSQSPEQLKQHARMTEPAEVPRSGSGTGSKRRPQLPRLERPVNACQRCRSRKQKCDLQYPGCSNCLRGGARCMIYDSSKGAEVPRDYVQGLEAKVVQLKAEVERLERSQANSASPMGSDTHLSPSQHIQPQLQGVEHHLPPADDTEIVVSMARVALGSTNEPRFMGTSSGVTLAKLVMSAIQVPRVESIMETAVELTTPSLSTSSSSLPPKSVATHLLELYFQNRSPYFTFLEHHSTTQSFHHAYEPPAFDSQPTRDPESHMFVVYMVLAIALRCGLKGHISSAQQSEGCFNSALKYIDSVFAHRKSDVQTISCLLLLAQYVTFCPSKGSLWHLSGLAIRLCIDLGMHWEGSGIENENSAMVDLRRGLFWTTYKLDRLLSITLGRPFGIVDQSISVALPAVAADHNGNPSQDRERLCEQKVQSNHLTEIYRLESEIKHVLYHHFKHASLAYPRPNYELWLPDINKRLNQWFQNVSNGSDNGKGAPSPRWIAYYSNALLLLHRPNPVIPKPSTASLVVCAEAARNQINGIRDLYRQDQVEMEWIWVHRLFIAGITTVYCICNSAGVRSKTTFETLIQTTQACSSTLSALAERFPGASGCRDNFDKLSAAALKDFVTKDITLNVYQVNNSLPNSANTSSPNLETSSGNQASLQQGIANGIHEWNTSNFGFQSPGMLAREWFFPATDSQIGTGFPLDDLELGRSLNSAAQWPETPGFFPW